jgi:3-oxoacyl-[acyl-carrier protein] reductase
LRQVRKQKEKSGAKTAVIIGASRGIDRAVAKRLAADGFAVVVDDAGKTSQAEEAVNEIKKCGGDSG